MYLYFNSYFAQFDIRLNFTQAVYSPVSTLKTKTHYLHKNFNPF